MKFINNFYQLAIFIIEVVAATLLFFGGYIIWKSYDEFNTFGTFCFIYGSLVLISFMLDDYCKQNLCISVLNAVLVIDTVLVACFLFIQFTSIVFTMEISETLIHNLSNIRTLTGNTKLFYWITLKIEDVFGCCRTYNMVSFIEFLICLITLFFKF